MDQNAVRTEQAGQRVGGRAGAEHFVDHHNADPQGFVWTKKAEDILAKVTRARAALDKTPSV